MLDEVTMGMYFIAIMVTFLLKLLSDLGVDLTFVKKYPEQTDDGKSSLLRSAFLLRLFSCVSISFIYVLIENGGYLSFINDISHITFLTLTLYWMHSFRELLLRLLQAEQNFTVYAGAQVLAALVKAVFICSLLLVDQVTIEQVLLIEIFAFALSILYSASSVRSRIWAAVRSKASSTIDILKFAYPLYLNALLNLGNERVSQYIVAEFGGPLAMAYYGMAERLADAGTRLFESFVNVYYPTQTSHFADSNENGATQLANRSMLWVTFIITSGIVAFVILKEHIIVLFFTDKYITVANAAALFFSVLLLRSTQTLMGYYGVAAGEKFLPVKVSLVSSVVNISLCFYMFKHYGYQGAISALVLTQLLMNALYYYWLKKANFLLSINAILTICLICIASVFSIYILEDNPLITLFIFPVFLLLCVFSIPALRADTILVIEKSKALVLKNSLAGRPADPE